jgi:hypothetical protein
MFNDGSERELVEITSSGLSHSCLSGIITSLVCKKMIKLYSRHRKSENSYYLGKNFGKLSIEASDGHLVIQIFSLESIQGGIPLSTPVIEQKISSNTEQLLALRISDIEYDTFFKFSFAYLQSPYYLIHIFVLLFIHLYLCRKLTKSLK